MRILSLRFRNLNSLAGEWTIDFTDPEYVSSGIFAITGPTGAGKSTILDALTLALYGRTPRLGKISTNAGEIMSRQTGDYFAEVEFVSDKGHYRCTWSQKRAHKKPDGELQPPKHEIVDVTTGVPLESKQAAVQQKVIDFTGLDYQQFTRSILLAQGDFATFLDAKAEERAPILEKITGTEIYGQISKKVHERFGQEKATLAELTDKADTIDIISREQAEAFRAEKQDHEQEILEITAHCKKLETAVAWLDTLAALETEISRLQTQQTAFTIRKEHARNDLGILNLARKARGLEGIYSGLSALRVQQAGDTAEQKLCEEHLAGFCTDYVQALEAFRSAQEKRDATLREKQREDAVLRNVRDLDTRIREIVVKRDEREKEKHGLENERANYETALHAAESKLKTLRQELLVATAYLESHAADQKLIASFSGIESSFCHINTLLKTAEEKRNELSEMEKTLFDVEESVLIRQKEADNSMHKVRLATTEADRIKKEYADIAGGRDIAALRALTDETKDRHDRLRTLLDLVSRIEGDTADYEHHAQKILAALDERTKEEKRHEQLQREEEQTAQFVKLIEKKLLLQAQIKSLEKERENLVEGTPCPLCGSTNHPWCTGTASVPDGAQQELDTCKKGLDNLNKNIRQNEARLASIDAEVRGSTAFQESLGQKIRCATEELQGGCDNLGLTTDGANLKPGISAAVDACIARLENAKKTLTCAEEKEQEIQRAENRVRTEKESLTATEKDYEKSLSYRDTKISDRNRLTKEIAAMDGEYKRQKVVVLESLQEYDILVFSAANMAEQILAELTKRRDAYTESYTQKQELQSSIQGCDAELEKDRVLFSTNETRIREVTTILTGIYDDLKNYSAQRQELYGEKDPAAEEARIARLVAVTEEELSHAAEVKNLADKQKNSCEDQMKGLATKISARVPVLQEKEQEFSGACTGAGFTGEEPFLSARISPDTFAELEELETNLIREETEIASGLKERTEKLAAERERSLTQDNHENLATSLENYKTRGTWLQIDTGRIRTKLEQYDEQVAKRQALIEEIARQKKEFSRWENLHDLIGSADGKKFRVFAQGLTFETLVVQANRHLRTMSDRYLLIRDRNSPLDLDIMDNYQAGEIRSTKNLSGGERFLVSLALALGLSGMASHNVRIDSLFLDEGFGTLDEDTLETALETLSSLQREGKIIGIISHVSALKERIPVQIQVEKIGGGRSRISGPGCVGPV